MKRDRVADALGKALLGAPIRKRATSELATRSREAAVALECSRPVGIGECQVMDHRRYVNDLGVELDRIELGEEVGPVPATNAVTN